MKIKYNTQIGDTLINLHTIGVVLTQDGWEDMLLVFSTADNEKYVVNRVRFIKDSFYNPQVKLL